MLAVCLDRDKEVGLFEALPPNYAQLPSQCSITRGKVSGSQITATGREKTVSAVWLVLEANMGVPGAKPDEALLVRVDSGKRGEAKRKKSATAV